MRQWETHFCELCFFCLLWYGSPWIWNKELLLMNISNNLCVWLCPRLHLRVPELLHWASVFSECCCVWRLAVCPPVQSQVTDSHLESWILNLEGALWGVLGDDVTVAWVQAPPLLGDHHGRCSGNVYTEMLVERSHLSECIFLCDILQCCLTFHYFYHLIKMFYEEVTWH